MDFQSNTSFMTSCSTLEQAKSKVQKDVLDELLYADEWQTECLNREDAKGSSDNYGLTIGTKKAEKVYQSASEKPYNKPNVTVNGQGY